MKSKCENINVHHFVSSIAFLDVIVRCKIAKTSKLRNNQTLYFAFDLLS